MTPQIWKLTCHVLASQEESYVYAFEVLGASVSWSVSDEAPSETNLTIYLPLQKGGDEASIRAQVAEVLDSHGLRCPTLEMEHVPDRDWLLENQKQFPPLTLGCFFIYNPIHPAPVPAGLIPLALNAAVAFGSGEHATTQGCLMALQNLHKAGFLPKCALDMGCGSGILGVAAALLWKNLPVLAADFDRFAVKSTLENAALNDLDTLDVRLSDGFAEVPKGPYDLILANILANPLMEMAPAMVEYLSTQGVIVLSGLLDGQAPDVLRPYVSRGLKCEERFSIGGWSTLKLVRP